MDESTPTVDRTTAVLSIRPVYADRILDGTKTIEFRRKPLPKTVETVLVWRTGKGGGVIGQFNVVRQVDGIVNDFVIQDFGGTLRTVTGSGIGFNALYAYAGHKGRLAGIYIGNVTPTIKAERFGWSAGPQAFRYAPLGWREVVW